LRVKILTLGLGSPSLPCLLDRHNDLHVRGLRAELELGQFSLSLRGLEVVVLQGPAQSPKARAAEPSKPEPS